MAHKPTSRDEPTMNPRKPLTSNHRSATPSRGKDTQRKRIASAKKPPRCHQRRRASKQRGFKGLLGQCQRQIDESAEMGTWVVALSARDTGHEGFERLGRQGRLQITFCLSLTRSIL